MTSLAVSDDHIVIICEEGLVCVYRNLEGYLLDFEIQVCSIMLGAVAFLNEDFVAAGGWDGNLYFISLSAKSVCSTAELGLNVSSIALVNDGLLALGSTDGNCAIIRLPESVERIVANSSPNRKRPQPEETSAQGDELEMWKGIGVSKDSLRPLKSGELVAGLAA